MPICHRNLHKKNLFFQNVSDGQNEDRQTFGIIEYPYFLQIKGGGGVVTLHKWFPKSKYIKG